MLMDAAEYESANTETGSIVTNKLQSSQFKLDWQSQSSIVATSSKQNKQSICVSSTFSKNEGDGFIKKTEIRVGNRIIIIRESFEVTAQNPIVDSKSNDFDSFLKREEEQPSQQSSEASFEENSKRKDRKNVVKNIVKGYRNWLRKCEDELPGGIQAVRKVEDLIQQSRFNNQLIASLLTGDLLRASFYRFLSEQAMRWIEQSKIQDKEAHRQSITRYRRAADTGKLQELRINTKGKRHKNSV